MLTVSCWPFVYLQQDTLHIEKEKNAIDFLTLKGDSRPFLFCTSIPTETGTWAFNYYCSGKRVYDVTTRPSSPCILQYQSYTFKFYKVLGTEESLYFVVCSLVRGVLLSEYQIILLSVAFAVAREERLHYTSLAADATLQLSVCCWGMERQWTQKPR